MFNIADHTKLSNKHIPPDWFDIGRSDYHVAVFGTKEPNCLIFAAQYNTMDLLGDCEWGAALEGKQMIMSGECSAFQIQKIMADWPHVILTWTPNV